MVPYLSYMFWNIFVITKEGSGSTFGHTFGSSKNDPKNIGICPESVISHLGIIGTPKNKKLKTKKTRKQKITEFVCRILVPIRPRLGPRITRKCHQVAEQCIQLASRWAHNRSEWIRMEFGRITRTEWMYVFGTLIGSLIAFFC